MEGGRYRDGKNGRQNDRRLRYEVMSRLRWGVMKGRSEK